VWVPRVIYFVSVLVIDVFLVPISFLVTLISAILAFSKSIRALLYGAVSYPFTFLVTRRSTSIYYRWEKLQREKGSVDRYVDKKITRLKEEALEKARKAEADAYEETVELVEAVAEAKKEHETV
jgi:hypothetical protein